MWKDSPPEQGQQGFLQPQHIQFYQANKPAREAINRSYQNKMTCPCGHRNVNNV